MPAPISARLLLFCYITSDLQAKGNEIIIIKEIKVTKENIRKHSKLDNGMCLPFFIYLFLPACFCLFFPASCHAFRPFLLSLLCNIDIYIYMMLSIRGKQRKRIKKEKKERKRGMERGAIATARFDWETKGVVPMTCTCRPSPCSCVHDR